MATAQETYAMLDKQSLWATAMRVHQALAAQSIAHAVVGGMAVCLHGYQRNTVDLDLLVPERQGDAVRACMQAAGFDWDPVVKEFRKESEAPVSYSSPASGLGRVAKFVCRIRAMRRPLLL